MKNCKDCNEFMCGFSGTDNVNEYCDKIPLNTYDFICAIANKVQDKVDITYKIDDNRVRFYMPQIDRCKLHVVDVKISEFYNWYETNYCADEIAAHIIYSIESAWLLLIKKEDISF
jgi:hypothetical protein